MGSLFFEGYVAAALWVGIIDANDLPYNPELEHLDESAVQQLKRDAAEFEEDHAGLLETAYQIQPKYTPEQAGHDFWLTRNGHGAGFWDQGLGRIGDALSKFARIYGEAHLYLGDDGKIYHS